MTTDNNEESTELTIPADFAGTMARPKSLDPNDRTGTENIGADELRLPRLTFAQALSPEITEGNSAFVEGLKNYDMFNNMTGEIYGRGPITFIPLRRDVRRIEFRPRAEGGGIVNMNVPKGDPRLAWTGVGLEREPPVATEFIEFPAIVLLPGRAPEPVVLSIKTTNKWNRRAADQLTLFIKLRNAPIYAGLYTVSSKPEKNDKGQFAVPVIKNAGFVPKDTPAGARLYAYVEQLAKTWEGKEIAVEREPADDADFDPAELEKQTAAGTTTDM